MKIKIVYLIGQLGLGGSERQLYLLLKHMDKTRFEPQVIVFNPSENYTLDEDLKRAGVSVYVMPPAQKNIITRVFWLAKTIKKIKPQIVHSWTAYINAYAGIAGRLAGVKILLGSVRGALHSPGYADAPALLRWLILHSVQEMMVNSEKIAEELQADGVPKRRIFMLPNCVEISNPQAAILPAHIPPTARLIGMVGNFRREKNYPLFIRGLARILPKFESAYGVIVGQPVFAADPHTPKQIQAEIESRQIGSRIWLAGFQRDVPSLLTRFEIFCLTSNSEGTPNALLEAMAMGLPIVTTRVGGIPQVVEDGVTGILIEPGDEAGLAAALESLLNDSKQAQKLGEAAQRHVAKNYSPNVIVPRMESYYDARADSHRK